jgi:hypothetical protein
MDFRFSPNPPALRCALVAPVRRSRHADRSHFTPLREARSACHSLSLWPLARRFRRFAAPRRPAPSRVRLSVSRLANGTTKPFLREELFMSKQKSTNKPVEEVRIGSVKAAIWKNDTESGPRFNVTFQRLYRDDESSWRSTESFGRDDLLVLAKVADQAHGRIVALRQPQRPQEQAK